MSFPICGLSSSIKFALVARDSTSEARRTAANNLRVEGVSVQNVKANLQFQRFVNFTRDTFKFIYTLQPLKKIQVEVILQKCSLV